MRQLLTESIVLGLAGGTLGLLFAQWGAQGLVALSPTDYSNWDTGVDLRVAFATFAAAAAAGIFFGLAPSLQALRVDLRAALHEGGERTASGGRARSRSALVIFEVALCTVLLIGAGLLIRTYLNLRNVELGFDPSNVLTARMSLEGAKYESARNVTALYEESLARIRELPGVESAAIVSDLPVERGLNLPIRIPQGANAGEITSVDWRYASPGYFRTMRIPLLRGRYIEETDTADSTPVTIVNQEFVRRFFGDDDPLGAHVEVHRFSKEVDDRPRQIVGVVDDVKTRGLAGPALATMFVPVAQLPDGLLKIVRGYSGADWVVRTRPGVEAGPAVRETIASLDPQQVFRGTRTMDQIIEASLSDQRFQSTLLAVFAGLALAMAAAGIYGLISYAVSQRTREIGIRMALGAKAETLLGTIVRQGIILGAVGVMLGMVASFAIARVLQGFVFGVSTSDPATFCVVGALLVVTAAVASLIPALSVLRLDPAATLRNE
jgi:predicted permease